MRRILPFLLSIIFLTPVYGKVIDYIIAVVNNSPILYSEVKSYSKLNNIPEKEALKQLINEKLLLEEAKKENITIPDSVVEDALNQIAKNNGLKNISELKKTLQKEGISLEDLKREIKNQLIIKRLLSLKIASKIDIPETEIEKVCKEQTQNIRKVYYITTDNKTLADKMVEKIKTEGFDNAAKLCQIDDKNCTSGFLGNVKKGTLIKEIDNAVWSAKIKEPVIVKVKDKYYVLYVTEEKTAKCDKEKVKKELTSILYQQKLAEFLKNLKKKSHIETFTIDNQ